jgi:hypothetical protein
MKGLIRAVAFVQACVICQTKRIMRPESAELWPCVVDRGVLVQVIWITHNFLKYRDDDLMKFFNEI